MLASNRLFARRGLPTATQLLVRTLFINTESTPNTNSLKFLPGREVLPEAYGSGTYFEKKDTAALRKSPLATFLLKEKGVKGVFLGRDFITVTKENDLPWSVLRPGIFTLLFDFFSEKRDVMIGTPNDVQDTTILESDSEIVSAIKELFETRVRPSVQEDGGDIFFHGFDPITGLVKVKLAGSCVGCPSSTITLRNGVENMLMHYIPEVKGIEEVTGDAEGEGSEGSEADKELKLSFKDSYTAEQK